MRTDSFYEYNSTPRHLVGGALDVSLVCSRWHKIVESSSRMWVVTLRLVDREDKLADHSSNAKLLSEATRLQCNIDIFATSRQTHRIKDFMSTMVPYARKWRDVKIFLHREMDKQLFDVFASGVVFDALTRLCTRCVDRFHHYQLTIYPKPLDGAFSALHALKYLALTMVSEIFC